MRAFLVALLFFLWLVLGWFYYRISVDCCQGGVTSTEQTIKTSSESGSNGTSPEVITDGDKGMGMSEPLMFGWSDQEPVLRDDWDSYRNTIIESMTDGDNIEITGLYDPDESHNTDFDNLGLARANKIKNLLSPPIDEDRIILKSKQIDADGSMDKLMVASELRKFKKTNKIDETIPDKTIIRFPPNSTRKLTDPEMEDYLSKLAERLKSSDERLRIIGHTDRLGSFASNIKLGKRRAETVKDYLISKGVDPGKIVTMSKGEGSPIASNDTAEGRAQNRRTELEIIK